MCWFVGSATAVAKRVGDELLEYQAKHRLGAAIQARTQHELADERALDVMPHVTFQPGHQRERQGRVDLLVVRPERHRPDRQQITRTKKGLFHPIASHERAV